MNITLREAIFKRVEGKSKAELRATIEDSIGNAEVTLPGIGVLFEMIWTHSAEETREQLVNTLHAQLAARTQGAEGVHSPS
ncbi:small acid-soluble spore protein SspI [Cohnella ginsengisoli]|uniref:Small, acid-soluble spore protein I n=1 Tax=Cohnella ginsengisoli TaxID=425004 RepID=A0A9X4KH35_9BACL|nr:small acid-soluble spore protein SspI [Cohnella ginsengisoli]MDG0791848.1 small acid-soluble spore protein SspI [Cohnella ginsengisoli]